MAAFLSSKGSTMEKGTKMSNHETTVESTTSRRKAAPRVLAALLGASLLVGVVAPSATATPAPPTSVSVAAGGTTPTGQVPLAIAPMADAWGVVAVHNGSWGYKEVVYGKATTRQIANAPAWDVVYIMLGAGGLWGIPLAVSAWTIKYRAQDAVNTGQCFAMVRPFWGAGWWAAKSPWGCR